MARIRVKPWKTAEYMSENRLNDSRRRDAKKKKTEWERIVQHVDAEYFNFVFIISISIVLQIQEERRRKDD